MANGAIISHVFNTKMQQLVVHLNTYLSSKILLYPKWYFVNFKQLDNESLSSITFCYLGTSSNNLNYQLYGFGYRMCVQPLASISFHQCNCHRAGLGRIIREGRPEAGCWGQAASSRPAPPVRLSLAKWQAGLISAVPSTNWMSGLEAN